MEMDKDGWSLTSFQRTLTTLGVLAGGTAHIMKDMSYAERIIDACVIKYAGVDGREGDIPGTYLRQGCDHSRPGIPSLLVLDEKVPSVRCHDCFISVPPVLDDSKNFTCLLCERFADSFHECAIPYQGNLVIIVNACTGCYKRMTK